LNANTARVTPHLRRNGLNRLICSASKSAFGRLGSYQEAYSAAWGSFPSIPV
jgi:hypothetical protein